jgi:hypothetical protein
MAHNIQIIKLEPYGILINKDEAYFSFIHFFQRNPNEFSRISRFISQKSKILAELDQKE